MTVLTATTGGVTFTLAASETTDPELITSIATAQAERINNTPAA